MKYRYKLLSRGAELAIDGQVLLDPNVVALAVASKRGHAVDSLLDAGADPNSSEQTGLRPLHAAAAYHNEAGVQALIKHAKDTLRIGAGTKLNGMVKVAVLVRP